MAVALHAGMELYYTFAGALVLGAMMLTGSALVFLATRGPRAARRLIPAIAAVRASKEARHTALSGLSVALVVALWLGFGSFTFLRAYDPSADVFVPSASIEWEPASPASITSFDRFDYGTATNAALARRS